MREEYSLEEYLQKKITERIDKRLEKVPPVEKLRTTEPITFDFEDTSNRGSGLVNAFVERRAKEIAKETDEKLRAIYEQGFRDGVESMKGSPTLAEGAL